MIWKGKELDKNIGSKSLYHFIQKLLVPWVRQQVAKPQVLMRSQQNCSKQERQYWIECTECVAIWETGKFSTFIPLPKVILNSMQITEQLFLSHMQARSFFGSHWKGSKWRHKRMNRRYKGNCSLRSKYQEHYQNGFVLRKESNKVVSFLRTCPTSYRRWWWGRPSMDFKVDYKLEGRWSQTFATLMASSCWPLWRQNYRRKR